MDLVLPQAPVPTTASYWPGTDAPAQTTEAAYKRSGKTKKDLLKNYSMRIGASKRWRKDAFDSTWRRLLKLYRGKQFVGLSPEDRVMVNICFSTVNTIVPSVAVNEPKITVTPRKPEGVANAQYIEAAVNYWWRRYKWKLDVKRAVKDSIQIGNGWVKLGWKYAEKSRPATPEELGAQRTDMYQQREQAAIADPAIAADLPSDDDIEGGLDTEIWEVKHDRPFVHRCSPFDIFIDPEATCDDDLKWIAQRIIVPIEAVKQDKRYLKAARDALSPDMAQNPRWRDDEADDSAHSASEQNDDIRRVTLWEYWDIQNEYYCVFSDKADGFLLEPTDFPFPFGHPFVHLGNYELTDEFYSVGDLEMIEPIQHELNGVRSDMANHRKRWQRAYLALRDKLDSVAQDVLGSDEDGRIVYIDGDEDLSRIIMPIPQTALDPQMYQYSQQVEADLDLVSGVTEYQRGSAPEIRRTATEANLLQASTDARVSDKLSQVEEFMATIAERVVQMAQIWLTQEETAAIVGKDGIQNWVTFTPDQIQGEYDFIVEAGSTTPKDDVSLRQDAIQLVQALEPFMGQTVDPKAVVTYLLQNAFDIKDVAPFLLQQQPQQGPQEKLIEQMSYKDAPEDIRRQMEQQAGFQPSQQGGSAQGQEQAAAQMQQQQAAQQHEAGLSDLEAQQQQQASALDHQESLQQQQQDAADEQQQQQQAYMQQLYLQRLTNQAQSKNL
jgi:hypothetical protein